MTALSGRLLGVRRVVRACFVCVTVISVAGCAPAAKAPVKPVTETAERAYLGPYPQGVAVHFDEVSVTLDSVEVSNLEWPYQDPASAAPQGSRWVYASFEFEGPGTNPAPGGGFFYPQYWLLIDGKTAPVDIRSSGGDSEAPPGVTPTWSLSFQVPEKARSATLLVTPAFAETQTVGFRLW